MIISLWKVGRKLLTIELVNEHTQNGKDTELCMHIYYHNFWHKSTNEAMQFGKPRELRVHVTSKSCDSVHKVEIKKTSEIRKFISTGTLK